MLIPSKTDDAIAFLSERMQAVRDEATDRAESRAELKASMARERLVAKLAAIKPIDVIAGLHSAVESAHGAALLAAWNGSTEQFGALVKAMVVDALEAEADLEAEELLIRIEGDENTVESHCSQCNEYESECVCESHESWLARRDSLDAAREDGLTGTDKAAPSHRTFIIAGM